MMVIKSGDKGHVEKIYEITWEKEMTNNKINVVYVFKEFESVLLLNEHYIFF